MSEPANIDLTVIRKLGGDHLDLPFWEGAARGELLLHRCGVCGRHYWPASRCVEHGARDMAWVRASGRGEVHSYTIVHHAYAPRMMARLPYCVAVLKLAEGPFFHTNIVDCPMADIHVGMVVAVRYHADENSGLTLPVFAPADRGGRGPYDDTSR